MGPRCRSPAGMSQQKARGGDFSPGPGDGGGKADNAERTSQKSKNAFKPTRADFSLVVLQF